MNKRVPCDLISSGAFEICSLRYKLRLASWILSISSSLLYRSCIWPAVAFFMPEIKIGMKDKDKDDIFS